MKSRRIAPAALVVLMASIVMAEEPLEKASEAAGARFGNAERTGATRTSDGAVLGVAGSRRAPALSRATPLTGERRRDDAAPPAPAAAGRSRSWLPTHADDLMVYGTAVAVVGVAVAAVSLTAPVAVAGMLFYGGAALIAGGAGAAVTGAVTGDNGTAFATGAGVGAVIARPPARSR